MSSQPPALPGSLFGLAIARPDPSRAVRTIERARRFDEAMQLMEDGRWSASFKRLAELADDGHPQAARIALTFVKRGTSLFGGTFHASEKQRDCWQRAGE
jgi:hypothetical protein